MAVYYLYGNIIEFPYRECMMYTSISVVTSVAMDITTSFPFKILIGIIFYGKKIRRPRVIHPRVASECGKPASYLSLFYKKMYPLPHYCIFIFSDRLFITAKIVWS